MHKNMKLRLIFVPFVLLLFLFACDDRGTQSTKSIDEIAEIHDPWPDENAELLALWASGEVCAPRYLYDIIHNDLKIIKSQWCDSIPQLCGIAVDALRPSTHTLCMHVDSISFKEMKEGSYNYWDSLNSYYNLEELSFSEYYYNYVALTFAPHLNIGMVSDDYIVLPGIEITYPSCWPGDASCLSLEIANGKRMYIYRLAWGDCPSGCMYSHYWKVQMEGCTAVLMAEWGDEVFSR